MESLSDELTSPDLKAIRRRAKTASPRLEARMFLIQIKSDCSKSLYYFSRASWEGGIL
jgi:hypothetical protein